MDQSIKDENKKDPILRPLFELGMVQRDRDCHKVLPRASILVLFFRFPTTTRDTDDDDDDTVTKEWHVLFTQRSMHLNSHPGEVCFPGGRQEDADRGNDVTTALRETEEEVGIKHDDVLPLARLETGQSVGGLCVTPIVGVWTEPVPASQLGINADEVEAAFYVPLSYFWDDRNVVDKHDIAWHNNETFTMRTYLWSDVAASTQGKRKQQQPAESSRTYKIWGLTAHVIYEVAQLCKPSQ